MSDLDDHVLNIEHHSRTYILNHFYLLLNPRLFVHENQNYCSLYLSEILQYQHHNLLDELLCRTLVQNDGIRGLVERKM